VGGATGVEDAHEEVKAREVISVATRGFDLCLFRFASRRIEMLAHIDNALGNGMALAPDEKSLLFTTMELRSGDLVMVEGMK
jgi:hypothetical protein